MRDNVQLLTALCTALFGCGAAHSFQHSRAIRMCYLPGTRLAFHDYITTTWSWYSCGACAYAKAGVQASIPFSKDGDLYVPTLRHRLSAQEGVSSVCSRSRMAHCDGP